MPLKTKKSKKIFVGNVSELLKSGKKLNQALAIAGKRQRSYGKEKKIVGKVDTSREIDTWASKGKVYQETRKRPRLLGPSGRSYAGITSDMPVKRTAVDYSRSTNLPLKVEALTRRAAMDSAVNNRMKNKLRWDEPHYKKGSKGKKKKTQPTKKQMMYTRKGGKKK